MLLFMGEFYVSLLTLYLASLRLGPTQPAHAPIQSIYYKQLEQTN